MNIFMNIGKRTTEFFGKVAETRDKKLKVYCLKKQIKLEIKELEKLFEEYGKFTIYNACDHSSHAKNRRDSIRSAIDSKISFIDLLEQDLISIQAKLATNGSSPPKVYQCPNCDSTYSSASNFCRYCGNKLFK